MARARGRKALRMEEVRKWVRIQLGGSDIEVELANDDIDACTQDAVSLLNRHIPMLKSGAIPEPRSSGRGIESNRHVVDLPGMIEVVDVHFLRKTQFIEYLGIENPFYLDAVQKVFRGGSAGEYMADITYLEAAKKVFSSHPEWIGDWEPTADGEGLEYALYVDISNIGLNFTLYLICFWAYVEYEASDDLLIGLPKLPVQYHHWFRNYVLARSKQILGRKLNKFGGIPSPDGGDSMTDGLSLSQDGKEEQKDLEKDALAFQLPVPPMTE